jgi:hypothetical protein
MKKITLVIGMLMCMAAFTAHAQDAQVKTVKFPGVTGEISIYTTANVNMNKVRLEISISGYPLSSESTGFVTYQSTYYGESYVEDYCPYAFTSAAEVTVKVVYRDYEQVKHPTIENGMYQVNMGIVYRR